MITEAGKEFATAGVHRSHEVFKQQVLKNVPFASTVMESIRQKRDGRIGKGFSTISWMSIFPIRKPKTSSRLLSISDDTRSSLSVIPTKSASTKWKKRSRRPTAINYWALSRGGTARRVSYLFGIGGQMKNLLLAIVLAVVAQPLFAQGAPPKGAPDKPYAVEYYYKVQWGHQQEFLRLFLKNHYPLLKKTVESGRMLAVKIETPANHMTEDARWDYRVTITFKNSTVATTANPDEETKIKQLWPDQDAYQREEQRRFEILLAHWDLPVSDVTP